MAGASDAAAAAIEQGRPWNGAKHVSDQYIVVLKDSSGAASAAAALLPEAAAEKAKAKGAEVFEIYKHALKGFAVKAPAQVVEQLRSDPAVASCRGICGAGL